MSWTFTRDLYALSEMLGRANPDEQSHGLLGGEWGYGQDFRNDVFMMHPFCWCERDDCEWCAGCECPDSAYHHFVDGVEVGYDEYAAFFDREVGEYARHSDDHFAWMQRADAANKRRHVIHDEVCRYCRGEFGGAPNFEHFASGLRVHWYKYIGRSMETNRDDLTFDAWQSVYDECRSSLVACGVYPTKGGER